MWVTLPDASSIAPIEFSNAPSAPTPRAMPIKVGLDGFGTEERLERRRPWTDADPGPNLPGCPEGHGPRSRVPSAEAASDSGAWP